VAFGIHPYDADDDDDDDVFHHVLDDHVCIRWRKHFGPPYHVYLIDKCDIDEAVGSYV
jgi:hypothetical protein